MAEFDEYEENQPLAPVGTHSFPHEYGRFINIQTARKFEGGKGKSIKVLFYENATSYNHSDQQENFVRLGANNSERAYHIDHGTQVAGIIGADDNGIGAEGIAPDALLYFLPSSIPLIKGLEYLEAGDILSLSIGTFGGGPIEYAFNLTLKKFHEKGIIIVCGAGNGNILLDDLGLPGTYDGGAIVVGGGIPWGGGGPVSRTSYGPRVDVSAPAIRVFTTEHEDKTGNTDYGYFLGTSAATPVVAGCCALIQSINVCDLHRPVLTPTEMRELIRNYGKEIDFYPNHPKAGLMGKFIDMNIILKKLIGVPDYNDDNYVGFSDFLKFLNIRDITIDEFIKHYGRTWPSDYPIP